MTTSVALRRWFVRCFAVACLAGGLRLSAQLPEISNAAGVKMAVDAKNPNPVLRITVPDGPPDEQSFKILIPEHVTVRAHGEMDAKHLYVFQPALQGTQVTWKAVGNSLEYATDFGMIHFIARATLVEDGILFRYQFDNHSATNFDMATAVTDPRFRRVFYDPRLERTYVHGAGGFRLLGEEAADRLTMPLKEWFPVRYMASYTVPVPSEPIQKRDDGITYRYDSKRVDTPMIATLSTDRTWVASSFSRDPGNVWSNPELTCQHVDPQVSLPPNGTAHYELKLLIFKGSLDEALAKVHRQLETLQ